MAHGHRRRISGLSTGTNFPGPLFTYSKRTGDGGEVIDEVFNQHPIHRPDWFDDFIGDVLADQWLIHDTSSAGAPTTAVKTATRNGIMELTLAADSEAEIVAIDWGNFQAIPATRAPLFQCRLNVAVLPITAERMVWGLQSARNSTLNSVATNLWFRLEASGALLMESDDGTTDNDDQATGVTLVAGTYYVFTIDARDKNAVTYWIADADGFNHRKLGTLAAAALAVTDLTQPVFAVQKDSGTGVPSMYIDYVRTSWDR